MALQCIGSELRCAAVCCVAHVWFVLRSTLVGVRCSSCGAYAAMRCSCPALRCSSLFRTQREVALCCVTQRCVFVVAVRCPALSYAFLHRLRSCALLRCAVLHCGSLQSAALCWHAVLQQDFLIHHCRCTQKKRAGSTSSCICNCHGRMSITKWQGPLVHGMHHLQAAWRLTTLN